MLCIIPVFRKIIFSLTFIHSSLWWCLAYKWVILMSSLKWFRDLLDAANNHLFQNKHIILNHTFFFTNQQWFYNVKLYLKVAEPIKLGCQNDPYTRCYNILKFRLIRSLFAAQKIYLKIQVVGHVQADDLNLNFKIGNTKIWSEKTFQINLTKF